MVGIRDYFYKMVFKSATLGLSGGIDSALFAALGAENIYGLVLPSKYSSDHSMIDDVQFAKI